MTARASTPPGETSIVLARRNFGEAQARPAAAIAPLPPAAPQGLDPAQQRLASVATPAAPTAPRAEPAAMYLSFSVMTPEPCHLLEMGVALAPDF